MGDLYHSDLDDRFEELVALISLYSLTMATTLGARRSLLLLPGVRNARFKSSYSLDRFSGGGTAAVTRWPVTRSNTIFNIVPQGYKYVVERFGKLHSIEDSGWFLAIPYVDTISYVVDVRELAIDIPPQSAITRDNVAVEVSGNLFIQFVDPQKAAYGALNPLYSVMQVRKGELFIPDNFHCACTSGALP